MAFVNINGPFVMGIDFGTESCRVAIFDLEGHPISFAATPYKNTTRARAGLSNRPTTGGTP